MMTMMTSLASTLDSVLVHLAMPAEHEARLARKEHEAKTKKLGEEMGNCVMSQSKFCVFGVIGGLPYSVWKRSYWPFAMLGIAGMG